MARLLYIFPHPDDESFGPAPAIARQRREGHDVSLLVLTRGEATRQRAEYGYNRVQMGAVRFAEAQRMARLLELEDLTVLDFPDGGLPDLDPRVIEEAVAAHVRKVRPDVVVTYAVHGVSGHPDHLVGHAVVKRVFCALRGDGADYLRRLAFFTLTEPGREGRPEQLRGSPDREIDCIVRFDAEDRRRAEEALDCYETYQRVAAAHRPIDSVADGVCFTLFQERHDPPLGDLTAALPAGAPPA